MRGKRIKLSLNPDREEDRRVMDYLYYSGTSISKAIKTAVLDYLDRRDGGRENSAFLQEVKEAVRESVQGLQLNGNLTVPVSASDEEQVSPFDFLNALESGVTFDESDPTFSG